MSTPYHARFFAAELSRHFAGDTLEKISHSLFDASVDLNPHQLEAALFAMRSPLSKGVLLADEVGLGKTIEAGLVMCQYWAERRRRLLVICPAALRKQWNMELQEKFHLASTILDARAYQAAQRQGLSNPFDQSAILITSIHFASRHSMQLRNIPWDLIIVDEAHKLRNVFQANNKMAQEINWALQDRPKLLLTATPLQNSLLELYGLASLIDEHIFGDVETFRLQFTGSKIDHKALRERLNHFCKRTLRSQVAEYIKYTERRAITVPFTPNQAEQALYDAISSYLQREDTYAVPQKQRHLMVLILRKLLASSVYAVAGTLAVMRERLKLMRQGQMVDDQFLQSLLASEEIESDYLEESDALDAAANPGEVDAAKLDEEIATLDQFIAAAAAITVESKAEKLLQALEIGFAEMQKMGARQKALIFTESRRTQDYLFRHLQQNGYTGQVVLFNGTNNDAHAQAVYETWRSRQQSVNRHTESRQIDTRTALMEHFRDQASIMIATEAAAEGLNMQFCIQVINYARPWNPQRIEQRIGRCHRYGQKHDVVVVNFINNRNEADQRVYELLEQKFNLFSGVFGASDEILGHVESGVDFENRILSIYQQCRSKEEIDAAFAVLQKEMEESITHNMDKTRRLLLEHFDQDVQARLRLRLDDARQHLNRIGHFFWELTRYQLADSAHFNDATMQFDLLQSPLPQVNPGRYHLISKARQTTDNDLLFRLSHPLGEYVIAAGSRQATPPAQVYFDVTHHPVKISMVDALKRRSGWLSLHHLRISALEDEDHLIFIAFDDQGRLLDQEVCEHLFYCRGAVAPLQTLPDNVESKMAKELERRVKSLNQHSIAWNNEVFWDECDKLEVWADEAVERVEDELAETRKQIKALTRQSRRTSAAVEQHQIQRQLQELETRKRRLRQKTFQVEDEIQVKRDGLIQMLEKRMARETEIKPLFTIRWSVI